MAKNYNIDDFENYLNGQTSAEERAGFQRELEQDAELAAEVEFHQDILKGINSGAEQDFSQLVKNVHGKLKTEGFFAEAATTQQVQKEAKVRRIGWVRALSLAASVAVLLVAAWWAFFQSPTPEAVYANVYTPAADVLSEPVADRLSETGFGINKAALQGLQNGITAYQSGDYQLARQQLLAFKTVAPTDELAPYASFYAALSALELEDYAAARTELATLTNQANFELSNDATWYAGLAALKAGDLATAKQQFTTLVNDAEFGERAQGVLSDLE